MKASQLLALMGAVTVSLAQSLPPAPTASVGCEPHGDHWHCEGPAESGVVDEPSVPSHSHSEGEGEDEPESTHPDLPPSPTASVGCEPHGDHWHCEGPVESDSPASASASATGIPDDDDDHDDDHDDDNDHDHDHDHDQSASGTESLPPSPTASVGCEPHGDHWHCEGPVASATDDDVAGPSSPAAEAGASRAVAGAGIAALAALLAL
ncbi:hypothetical protein ACRALDRAFT_1065485 [Sodiomyces alcalophilus JCM 7366]|uniref:uncharacterized protein n=1 Tax=Sodiomyces alcalophilus JCM 7366 TaxID=591952 RepID=UPI0039B390A6